MMVLFGFTRSWMQDNVWSIIGLLSAKSPSVAAAKSKGKVESEATESDVEPHSEEEKEAQLDDGDVVGVLGLTPSGPCDAVGCQEEAGVKEEDGGGKDESLAIPFTRRHRRTKALYIEPVIGLECAHSAHLAHLAPYHRVLNSDESKKLITGFLAEHCYACCMELIARFLQDTLPPICIIKGSHNNRYPKSGLNSLEMVNLNIRSCVKFRIYNALRSERTESGQWWDRGHNGLCFVDHFDCATLIPKDKLSQMQRVHGNVFNPGHAHDVIFKCGGANPSGDDPIRPNANNKAASMIILTEAHRIGLELQLS